MLDALIDERLDHHFSACHLLGHLYFLLFPFRPFPRALGEQDEKPINQKRRGLAASSGFAPFLCFCGKKGNKKGPVRDLETRIIALRFSTSNR
jgi:hypothetical protein